MALAEYGWTITNKKASEEWDIGEYKVMNADTGGGTFAPGSTQSIVKYICEYFYIENFIDTVLGKTVKDGAALLRSAPTGTEPGDTGYGSTPEEHPYWYNQFAVSADVQPRGVPEQSGDFALWNKAVVNVVFRPNNYNIISDENYALITDAYEYLRYTSKIPEGQCDLQTTLGFFKFVDDPDHRQLTNAPTFAVPSTRFVYTWKQIPVVMRDDGYPDLGKPPNMDTILQLSGCVNLFEFDGFPPGTVLFVQPGPLTLIQPQAANPDSYYWDLSYVLSVRDYGTSPTPYVADEHRGWNYAFDTVRGVWDLYTSGEFAGTVAGKPNYEYKDLRQLFAVTW